MEPMRQKALLVAAFGIFFGLTEAVVVVYLRELFGVGASFVSAMPDPKDVLLSLGVIAFLAPEASLLVTGSQRILTLELWREAATIGMLLALALAVGKDTRQRLAYFLLSFAVWDILYYVFLKALIGWPSGLLDLDIFFFIPVAWVGPVATPITASFLMAVVAAALLFRKRRT